MNITLEWLKAHALFGCQYCYEDCSRPANDLRFDIDGELVCEDCFDQVHQTTFDDDGNPILEPDWCNLEPFEPFKQWERET